MRVIPYHPQGASRYRSIDVRQGHEIYNVYIPQARYSPGEHSVVIFPLYFVISSHVQELLGQFYGKLTW